MTMRIGSALPCLAVALLTASPPVGAQTGDSLLVAFEAVRTRQRFLVSGSLQLTPTEEAAFWPVYDAYDQGLAKLDARAAKLLTDFLAVHQSIHPATADALIQEHLDLGEARLKALKAHVAQLRPILASATLARYVQLLNKLEISLNYDLAQRVPLLQ